MTMYLSYVNLVNWRSYADATFEFKAPTSRRPLVLIGAMNGHGKTSFLMALYLGLFGRFGLRHAEGFAKDEDFGYYRDAITKFRRAGASPDEPSSIELVFSPTAADKEESEVRIVRRWFFNSVGKPRGGDSFETIELYTNGKPHKLHSGVDAAHDRLERLLFPAHFMPAFFFDGEQAQSLIHESGAGGIKRSVEVLFGTKVVDETGKLIREYIKNAHAALGGKRSTSSQQKRLDEKLAERQQLEDGIARLTSKFAALDKERSDLERAQKETQESLARLGGERSMDIEAAHSEVTQAEREKADAERALTETARKLGIALAVSRLARSITNRLESEAAREEWLGLKRGTISRIEEVLQVALPEPPESDDLLGNLPSALRSRVRERFAKAIERIWNPPPPDCAEEFLLGHASGESRTKLLDLLAEVRNQTGGDIRQRAKKLKEARERLEDAVSRRDRLGNLPTELGQLSAELQRLGEAIADVSRQMGGIENELRSKRGALHTVNAEITPLQNAIARLEPEQRRIAVAERVHRVLDELDQKLGPITLARLQSLVTNHFTQIADRRFKGGEIVFPDGERPVLRRPNHEDSLIEMMSGFERRSFGIAFSLALAEITGRRLPMIIDTPLGNADTEYRERLLRAITQVDLDQVIILTHDAEVTGELFEQVESEVRQTFLVEFDRRRNESKVIPEVYFNGVGR